MSSGIYRIHNTVTGKNYVGSSKNMKARKNQHFYLLGLGKCHSKRLQNSFNVHGVEAFVFEVLEECELERLSERELHWLKHFDAVNNGYNSSEDVACPTRGFKHSDETKKRMSEANKRRPITAKVIADALAGVKLASDKRRGSKLTDEHKARIGAANKGKKHSDEFKARISERMKANPPCYWKGRTRSEEEKKKMSDAKKGKPQKHRCKPIVQFDANGLFIAEFESVSQAAKDLGISASAISNNINGTSKKAGKFIFKAKSNGM